MTSIEENNLYFFIFYISRVLKMKNVKIFLCFLTGLFSIANTMLPLNTTECLEWHNRYRAIHQAPSLNWSDTLAARAQVWADDLANRDAFEHDTSRGLEGENLYMSSEDSQTACKSGTYAFYKEEKFYDYDNPGFSLAVGHFTQLVWLSTKELGVAKSNTSSGSIILVYRYSPSGNFLGEFADNVKPPFGNHAFSTYTASLLMCSTLTITSIIFGLTSL